MAHRTRWAILVEQLNAARKVVTDLESQMNWMILTPFTANGTGRCSKCDAVLETEMDFADHFLVPDEQLRNLGYCPTDKSEPWKRW